MLLDVKRAFLCGHFENGEKIYIKVPQGFEHFYSKNAVQLLLKTIYGLKQVALAFWRELLKAFQCMKCREEAKIFNVDNKGAKDLWDNWSVGGRSRHVEVKQMFLRELKESKVINTNWIPRSIPIGIPEKKGEAISTPRIFQVHCLKSTDLLNLLAKTNI
jgi:hypothetical protein